MRERKYFTRYGITIADYDRMLENQNFQCKMCHRTLDEVIKPTSSNARLCVDHNHTTGKVRGLLCTLCNSMIAHARESIKILEAGIQYLQEEEIAWSAEQSVAAPTGASESVAPLSEQ